MAKELMEESDRAGLQMSSRKTKTLCVALKKNIIINGKGMEEGEKVEYQGQLLSFEDGRGKEIRRCIEKGWRSFWKLGTIYKAKMEIRSKIKILDSAILPSVTYGAQTRALTKQQIKKIRSTQRKIGRKIVGVRWDQRITSREIRGTTGALGIGYKIKKLKLSFVGNLAREKREKWGRKKYDWIPWDHKRLTGNPL